MNTIQLENYHSKRVTFYSISAVILLITTIVLACIHHSLGRLGGILLPTVAGAGTLLCCILALYHEEKRADYSKRKKEEEVDERLKKIEEERAQQLKEAAKKEELRLQRIGSYTSNVSSHDLPTPIKNIIVQYANLDLSQIIDCSNYWKIDLSWACALRIKITEKEVRHLMTIVLPFLKESFQWRYDTEHVSFFDRNNLGIMKKSLKDWYSFSEEVYQDRLQKTGRGFSWYKYTFECQGTSTLTLYAIMAETNTFYNLDGAALFCAMRGCTWRIYDENGGLYHMTGQFFS